MTAPQPGPYPEYPGGGGMPPAQPKPPLPDTVRNAFYLMLAGAALQAISIIVTLAQIGTVRDQIEERVRNNPSNANVNVDTVVNVTIASVVVAGLIGIGLWLWMAFANKAGKNWARITGTVFFGIATLSTLIGLAVSASDSSTMSVGSSGTAVGETISIISWLIGLATVILLWNRRSTPYFKPPSYGYQYQPPGATSGYPPTGPGPAPGQTAPPAGPPPSDGPQDMPPPR